MKERFAKLLLGEDMSGGGKGVCTALAISNAITNLSGLFLPYLSIRYHFFCYFNWSSILFLRTCQEKEQSEDLPCLICIFFVLWD